MFHRKGGRSGPHLRATDRTGSIVTRDFPAVRLIRHSENRGIASARNTVWRRSNCDVIIYVDLDTVLPSNLLATIVDSYDSEDIAGVGGQGLEIFQKNRADRWRNDVLFQSWGNTFRQNVPFLFGICSSYRKSVLEELDGFDDAFRYSGEDMDLGYRIQSAGYRLVYQPEAKVIHLRQDDEQSIERMTFRHCYWGFSAQIKNNCYESKVSLFHSAVLLYKQIVLEGLLKGDIRGAYRTFMLYWLILRAWIEANNSYPILRKGVVLSGDQFSWEGHQYMKPCVNRPKETLL